MNKIRNIVIISGKQFAGKDTVANVLMKKLTDFKLAPIADAIKIGFGQEKNIAFNEIERNKPLYRAELIEFGNRYRAEDPDYWLKKVLETEGSLIISDVRLKREIEVFENLGAIKIRVEADREERAKRGRLVKEDDPTETELDNYENWDYVLENNGTIEEIKAKAAEVGDKILEGLLQKA